ncbi:diaminohydroxyphosphoribosylaminopyrimidine deaminase [Hypnocyclicus thermotrophus]|uniref:Riboflavin biosynthesis protein RibD n=1 Tax=Hypnocyclicus thermotrophus TaxID=1627895 RepID=A0AA46E022_9FUSO|nr:bifunctional diaminohydroxyphosphoribosylaminopyrimidine deaminase/5-amino-6-(5-phosphoribosylamino)uracil reductase RibD [Hypnocyclicus thermotrophus]TDT72033.1 diaminohydroxyphosphoribosylaminopyrimidine deaminase [Hypnocyclicus thermotrophus]
MQENKIHEKYMKLALELAKKGEGAVNPNPLVGALVVKNNQIIGKGYHKYFGGPHAEVYALNEAGDNAKGADIYVTLEPCSHYGKTPPCVKKIIEHNIKRCFIAIKDPNPLVSGRGIKLLQKSGIEVKIGILENEGKEINRVFFKYIKEKLPYIHIKIATTLDGKIATKTGDSKWITNEKSRKYVHYLRNKYMGILVGINTVKKDNPNLNVRNDSLKNHRDPFRIILDPSLKIDKKLNIIKNNNDEKTILITQIKNKKEKQDFIEELSNKYKIKFIFLNEEKFKFKDIFKEIYNFGIDSILVEGGGFVLSNLFKEKELIDEGSIFIAPKILGDKDALSFITGFEISKIKNSIQLENVSFKNFDNDICLEFKRGE